MNQTYLLLPDGQKFTLKEWTVIGKDPECDLSLTAPGLADRHARIEKRGDSWVIKDLRSPSGVWVNGNQVIEAVLHGRDLLRLGTVEFHFHSDGCVAEKDEFPLRSRNPEWNEVLRSLGYVAKTPHPVLLLGPSGTGKDVIAQAIHNHSHRRHGPMISVNCGALTESLVESELFGHVKGSFTGALNDRKGAFEAARGGTLFLDEIGDLPMALQSKLLRALENQEIRPVGSDRTIKTDIRLIAATHQDLEERVREGRFRQDLFFRLNVVTICPPPLKQRMEDFEDLFYSFCRSLRVRFSVTAIRRLEKHTWPGNIRELKNLVTRASALIPSGSVEESDIDRLLGKTNFSPGTNSDASYARASLPVIQEIEREMILKRLRANKGNQRRTANDLGLPKSTLHDRIRAYGIDVEACKV